jgi:hypothetical protein
MINIKLTHFETLVYYDSPQLFISVDTIGTKYICLLSEQNTSNDLILIAPVSNSRLKTFLLGSVELKEVFIKPEAQYLFIGEISDYNNRFFNANSILLNQVKSEWLPDEGFYLQDYLIEQDELMSDAREKSRGVVYLSLNNEETKYESKFNSIKLAEALISFQSVVKYAYKRAIKSFSPTQKKKYSDPSYYLLDTYAFTPGSFKVKLQSNALSNMLGESELSRALFIIDELVETIDNPEISLELLTNYKGHLANTYIKFLETITHINTSFSYQWGSAAAKKSVKKTITQEKAAELYDLFNTKEYLQEETVDLVGVIEKVDASYGSWRLVDDEGQKHTGKIKDNSGITLKGVIIMKRKYNFTCIEKIVEILGTGEEKVELQLIKYQELK